MHLFKTLTSEGGNWKALIYWEKSPYFCQKCPFSSDKKWDFKCPNLRADSKNLAKHLPKWWMCFHFWGRIKPILKNCILSIVLESFFPLKGPKLKRARKQTFFKIKSENRNLGYPYILAPKVKPFFVDPNMQCIACTHGDICKNRVAVSLHGHLANMPKYLMEGVCNCCNGLSGIGAK